MLGLGLALTNFGSRGGIADAADSRSGAAILLAAESNGLAIDFTDMSMQVKDVGTPANNFLGDPNSKLTYASPSTKWILDKSGIYVSGTTLRTEYDGSGNALGVKVEGTRTNLFLNPRSPVTQSITTTAQSYTISGLGAVGATLVLSGTATGTLTGTAVKDRDKFTFTATAGTLTVTVTGVWDFVQVEAGSFATSPIVNAGSTVTRAADNISIGTGLFPSIAAEVSLYAKVATSLPINYAIAIALNNAGVYTAGPGFLIRVTSSIVTECGGNLTSVSKAISPSLGFGEFIKIAGGAKVSENLHSITNKGQAVASAATVDWNGTSNRLQIGALTSYGTQVLDGWIAQVVVVPRYDTAWQQTVTT